MALEFDSLPFDVGSSPWLQRALNEDFRSVWGYWGDVVEPFVAEKLEIEQRSRFVLDRNDHEALLRFAARDHNLIQGMAGPRSVVDPDPLRVAAFRVVEISTWYAVRELALASIEPAAETDFVCRKTPGLWQVLSPRDHLLPINKTTWPSECKGNVPFFVVGDRAVYPHPLVFDLRELMWDVIGLGLDGFAAKLAIDPVRTTTRADACQMLLADYWFGCKLTRDTIDSLHPEHLGETWHMRPADRPTTFATHPVAATVFRWSADGYVKKLEVVEIAPRDSRAAKHGPYVLNRYLHALRDTRLKRFTHVDGAVRAYARDTYQATQANPKGNCGEAVRYRKLFRVDGAIEDAAWGKIVAHYFRGNELVIEYFGELDDARGWAAPPDELPTSTVPAMQL